MGRWKTGESTAMDTESGQLFIVNVSLVARYLPLINNLCTTADVDEFFTIPNLIF